MVWCGCGVVGEDNGNERDDWGRWWTKILATEKSIRDQKVGFHRMIMGLGD